MANTFSSTTLSSEPKNAYDEYVNTTCLDQMDFRVPSKLNIQYKVCLDGCKASVCFHNGFWMMNTYYPF